ncbi:hypothetical protein V8E52_002507, partial [Russula decolorans]
QVLGPFPIHAREQHFLSPSFPLDLTEHVDLDASYPSSLADGGSVPWSKAMLGLDGNLAVSFPHIRWASLRTTEGWAGLQHHAVLRTTLTVHPPCSDSQSPPAVPNFLVELKGGSFFTLVPADVEWKQRQDFVPEWYSGNIYQVDCAPPHLVNLPTVPSAVSPTVYYLYIRLFGDPKNGGSEAPTLIISVNARFESSSNVLNHETSYDIAPDFVEGFAFGDALGVGLRCLSTSWWTVTAVSISNELRDAGIMLSLLTPTRFAPGQTRILPIRISQSKPFYGDALSLDVSIFSVGPSWAFSVRVSVTQLGSWSGTGAAAIRASYFSPDTTPIGFIALPPKNSIAPLKTPTSPILALHGAGVDVLKQPFWVESLPRQQRSWIIVPSGRTPWGLDWHGPSADDAWGTVSALTTILETSSRWKAWAFAPEKVIIIGHSNGGQGTWYNAARYPDRVVAMIPAAGFIKAQAYVPLNHSRSAHFIDPFLRAILESSFTPDDNDLFLSNLVDTPSLVSHGSIDENVPTWHSRELVSVLRTWATDAIVSYREEPGQGHWYPSVFKNPQVKAFLDSILDDNRPPPRCSATFTLTSAVPANSGSFHGWRILFLVVPGRLARLTVERGDSTVSVVTCNVGCFSVDATQLENRQLDIDGCTLAILHHTFAACPQLYFQRDSSSRWTILSTAESPPPAAQRSTNPYSILRSSGRLKIVVSTSSSQGSNGATTMSIARRLANDLLTYFRLDADIVPETEMEEEVLETDIENEGDTTVNYAGTGNVVVIGGPSGRYIRRCLAKRRTAFSIADQEKGPPVLQLRGEPLNGISQGIMFTHPHESSPSSRMLFIIANDQSGLERAVRLFPIRTGLALADWMVIGKRADKRGAAGIEKAGLWGCSWEYHSGMSWQH